MATPASVLVVGPDADANGRCAALLTAHGVRSEACGDADEAARRLPAASPDLLVVSAALPAAVLPLLGEAAHQHDAALVLHTATAPTPEQWQHALAAGCAAVLPADAEPATVAAVLAAAGAARQRVRTRSEEALRLRFQSDDLRRRCAQQADRLRETQETFFLDLSRMMNIITNIMDGIVFVDRAGNVTLMNPAAEDLLGTKSFVAIGKPVAALPGRQDLVQTLVADHARLSTQKEVIQTVEVHHNEQDLIYVKCMTSRVLDYRGQPAGVLTVLRDVTAEFKSDQLKNQYLSIVAHELRTPLTGIKTFATMLTKGTLGVLGEHQQRVCESIREQSVRLEHQIDKLINLGNLESADYGQDREIVPVADFVVGLLAPFEQPARDRRIALSLQVEAGDERLYADRADMRRACQALVENAVKFAKDGGRVEVRIEPIPGGGLRFGVRDDGIGIDPRYHRRIFEKFFQVEDPLTRHHGGAGLGLFVARGIVEAHGSRIEISSQLGSGADFSFVLPLYEQSKHAVTQVATTQEWRV
ncbi:MAG: PAS domain-containing protein [Planctomycetes bacterium]|nr:PAS domain-containing protein [Planctomycetota bacterium]